VGGLSKDADNTDVYVIKANGKIVSQRNFSSKYLGWDKGKFYFRRDFLALNLEQGDTVVIPEEIKVPILWMPLIRDVTSILSRQLLLLLWLIVCKMKKIAIFIFFLSVGTAFAHPNMNLNVEETNIYDASSADTGELYTIKPLPVRRLYLSDEKLNLYENKLPVNEESGWYFKPINSIDLKFFGTNEETMRLEGTSGLELKKGGNFFPLQMAIYPLEIACLVITRPKTIFNKDDQKNIIISRLFKVEYREISIEGGKDNVNWGPGEYGLLLSNNVPPYYLVKVQNEIPLKFFGEWDIAFLHGWLKEDRKDVSDPRIMGMRIVYRPFSI